MKVWKVVAISLVSAVTGVIAGMVTGTVASDKIKEVAGRVCKKAEGDEVPPIE